MNIWTLRAYSISIGEENMNVLIIISCICFLFICMRIFVVPIKLMVKLGINSILGIIFILIVILFLEISLKLDSYIGLFMNAIWISICIVLIFFIINSFVEKKARKIAWQYLKSSFTVFFNR